MTKPLHYRVGSIVIIDDGCNLVICKSHTPSERIVIERADREDLLTCLMQAQDARIDLSVAGLPEPNNTWTYEIGDNGSISGEPVYQAAVESWKRRSSP